MIGYNPSHLNTNETLLEAFHRVEEYLKANPMYQVYQSYAPYQDGKQEYALDTIVVPEGSTVGKGDVVLFSNVYYTVITAVSDTTFSIATATSFRGLQGEQGSQGPKGDTGATGTIALEYGETHTENYEGDIANEPIYLALSGFNRTPVVNDRFLLVFNVTESGKTYIAPFTVLRVDATQAYVSLSGNSQPLEITGPIGATGPQGPAGTTVYNNLSDIPVINQDLTASGFTPVANTYYRHIGATTVSFTQGIIYLYDTAYHKLGESGGTTLNRYEWTIAYGFANAEAMRLARIFDKSKGRIDVFSGSTRVAVDTSSISVIGGQQKGFFYCHSDSYTNEYVFRRRIYCFGRDASWGGNIEISATGAVINNHPESNKMEPTKVIYYNDTEIA